MHRNVALLLLIGSAVLSACSTASQAPTPTTASKPAPATVAAPVASPAAASSPSVAASSVPSVASLVPSVAASPAVSPAASVAPSPSAVGAVSVAASPTTAAQPTATPSAAIQTAWVGNTEGTGVYLRNSPTEGDRGQTLNDGTPLTVTGEEVEGDGQRWLPVLTADGTQGYVQVIYTTRTEPTGPTTQPQGQPK